jgi:predicted transglutaminase-like cysteine proteinase
MPVVMIDQAHWAQLEQVQMQVDQKVAYASDMERFGVPDWWEPATDKGDCEDIVLAKRKKLMEMGWDADVLRIAVVIDGHGALHAVLTVDVLSQAGKPATYVLDSHFQHVEPWQVLNQYGYTWLERSKPGSIAWSRLDNGTPAETTRIASLASQVMPASPRWDASKPATDVAIAAPVRMPVTASVSLLPEAPVVAAAKPVPAALDAAADQSPLLIKASYEAPAADADDDDARPASAHVERQARHHGPEHGHEHSRGHGHGRRHTA